ncbi:histidine phosphatase family protein [Reyranella sp.]|uniref:histidine phosphatase family protein n=1 Tax=Reyranella sp. TaxID=1929291 RepID=UPI003BAB187F
MRAVPFALLRHAPTAWNADGRLQGLTDTALSPEGERAARSWRLPAPADGWKRVSSPLQRARRTAELVRPSTSVTIDSRLREMSFGLWEGFTVKALRATGGEAFAAAEAAGLDFHPPGGESPRMTMVRLSLWSSTLTEPVVAVSHKAAIRALLALATGWNMLGRPPHKLDWKCAHFFVAQEGGRVAIERLNVPLTR